MILFIFVYLIILVTNRNKLQKVDDKTYSYLFLVLMKTWISVMLFQCDQTPTSFTFETMSTVL